MMKFNFFAALLCFQLTICLRASAVLPSPSHLTLESRASAVSVLESRQGIPNTMYRILREKEATIGFLGGSITEMNGYVDLVQAALQKRFPDCRFTYVRSGISSTCSDTGAFRLENHILSRVPKLDLLFVEFAVNDNQDGHFSPLHSVRGMEGIVQQIRRKNPSAEIVFLLSANESHLANFARGVLPQEIAAHRLVAERYGLPTICFAKQVSQDILSGKYDWKTFGGVHPAPFGCQVYAELVDRFFAEAIPGRKINAYPELPLLDAFSFARGRILPVRMAKRDSRWQISVPDWESVPGKKRGYYLKKEILHSVEPGAEFSLEFTGTAIGFLTTAGLDAGMVEYSIDGAPFQKRDTFHEYSRVLHYPYTVLLEEELPAGRHTLVLRISAQRNPESQGHALRIFGFTAN